MPLKVKKNIELDVNKAEVDSEDALIAEMQEQAKKKRASKGKKGGPIPPPVAPPATPAIAPQPVVVEDSTLQKKKKTPSIWNQLIKESGGIPKKGTEKYDQLMKKYNDMKNKSKPASA